MDVALDGDANTEFPGTGACLSELQLPGSILALANLQDADLSNVNYTTDENSSEEICTEIFKDSNPDLSEEEIQKAFDSGDIYPCPAIWVRAIYNDFTAENPPDADFDFDVVGMIHIDELSQERLCDYRWYKRKNDC